MVESSLRRILLDPAIHDAWLGPVDSAIQELIHGPAWASAPEGQADLNPYQLDALQRILKRLPDLFDSMETGPLEERIAEAMFAGDLNGRIERLRVYARDSVAFAEEPPNPLATVPKTFGAARAWFESKTTAPTGMSSLDIALDVPAPVRMQAFFSARIASANVLQSLREEAQSIIEGKTNYADARMRLTEFLAKEGYGIPAPGDKGDRDVRDIASTARLELILSQNVAMAHAIGQRAVSEHPAVRDRYPFYRYLANTDRHEEFDGLVLPKDHPFWQTHYPPWDFNCRCIAVDDEGPATGGGSGSDFVDTAEGGQIGRVEHNGRVLQVDPAASGFVFRSDPAEAFTGQSGAGIEDAEIRRRFEVQRGEKEREIGTAKDAKDAKRKREGSGLGGA